MEVSWESMTTEQEMDFFVLVKVKTMGDSEGMEQGGRLPAASERTGRMKIDVNELELRSGDRSGGQLLAAI